LVEVAGFSSDSAAYDFSLARYNGDGTLDSTFGTGGKVRTAFGSFNDYGNAVVLQADGKIVMAGRSNDGTADYFALARYEGSTSGADTVSQDAPAGGTVSTGSTPTPSDPVETSVTTPFAGRVTIEETSISQGAPSGYEFVGQQVNITAPDATALDPLRLVFRLDASILPPGGLTAVSVTRNGTLVPDCAGAPGVALPDPCLADKSALGGGDVQLTVLTSKASAWNFAVSCQPLPTPARSTRPGKCVRSRK
jgi:uncharacterized delta-60 repeat protein